MADDVARAVGASSGDDPIMIAGKECTIRPLGIRELTELERICLKEFKTEYLRTYAEGIDLIENGREIFLNRLEEVARWDVSDLPPKFVYDPERMKVTKSVRVWLKDNIGYEEKNGEVKKNDPMLKQLCASSLDDGMLSEKEYKKLTGESPVKQLIPYSSWWLTGCKDGQISMLWICFKSNGITKEDILNELTIGNMNLEMMSYLSRQVENVTVPAVGNG